MTMIELVEKEIKHLEGKLKRYQVALEVLLEMKSRDVEEPLKVKKPRTKREPRADRSEMRADILKILEDQKVPHTMDQIARAMGLNDSSHRTAFYKVISNMYREGRVHRDENRLYTLPAKPATETKAA